MYASGGVEEGRDTWVGGTNKLGSIDALSGLLLAFMEEVEEETVEGTGWWSVSNWSRVARHLETKTPTIIVVTSHRVASMMCGTGSLY